MPSSLLAFTLLLPVALVAAVCPSGQVGIGRGFSDFIVDNNCNLEWIPIPGQGLGFCETVVQFTNPDPGSISANILCDANLNPTGIQLNHGGAPPPTHCTAVNNPQFCTAPNSPKTTFQVVACCPFP